MAQLDILQMQLEIYKSIANTWYNNVLAQNRQIQWYMEENKRLRDIIIEQNKTISKLQQKGGVTDER